MAFTRRVRIKIDNEPDIEFELKHSDGDDGADNIDIKVMQGPKKLFEGQWQLDLEHMSINFTGILSDPTTQCIAQCLGISVGKTLLHCLWKHRRDLKKLRKCLEENALGALMDAVQCIYRCLHGQTAGTP